TLYSFEYFDRGTRPRRKAVPPPLRNRPASALSPGPAAIFAAQVCRYGPLKRRFRTCCSPARQRKRPQGENDMSYPNVQLYIDGKWRAAASGKTIPVINPATEETIGTVPHAGKADLDEALAAAEKGFKAWRNVSPYERSKVMRKAAELIRERADAIAT